MGWVTHFCKRRYWSKGLEGIASMANGKQELAEDVKQKLEETGFTTSNITQSDTSYGTSRYITATAPNGTTHKFRISDHSVENNVRASEEYHVKKENIGNKIVEAEQKGFPERFNFTNKIYVQENKSGGKSLDYHQPSDKILSKTGSIFLVERQGAKGIIERK